ncbi:hypothetical protein JG687_00014902 [Phytophthora cactorum]|uniref:Uncharacterized protein n=1 Tax=Phytophthora cactorum TaxID=29920 RepID=A0A8T1TYF0_9STRA|nr:hypothetical protein GQ600_10748 [Phytophthora cactorum]KAF1784857.1 hypothetical protein GQ600_24720 [Phytophthora cactorum]KAG6949374.1 hypothetical protein JG687_00014902 [Phytophthora cactorum]
MKAAQKLLNKTPLTTIGSLCRIGVYYYRRFTRNLREDLYKFLKTGVHHGAEKGVYMTCYHYESRVLQASVSSYTGLPGVRWLVFWLVYSARQTIPYSNLQTLVPLGKSAGKLQIQKIDNEIGGLCFMHKNQVTEATWANI